MTTPVGFATVQERTQQITKVLDDMRVLVDTKSEGGGEIQLASTGQTLVPGLNMPNEAKTLHELATDLGQGVFTIIVTGTFKNGKSTLLNALLGDKALPASAAPTTGIITLLVHGESDAVEVYKYDRTDPEVLDRAAFFEEYRLKTEDADELKQFRFQNVRFARIECRHAICAKGVRLVDSPGLGEHTSRSELTTNFLQKSQAVVLVLNAIQLLSQQERAFIADHLGTGRLAHVFFVVNRINQIEDVEELQEVQERAMRLLTPHFLDETGAFDRARFDDRVFWVNARGALSARQRVPPDLATLAASGVNRFEEQLESFLTDASMLAAALSSTLQTVLRIGRSAQTQILDQKQVLHQPLADLRKRRDEVGGTLTELNQRIEDIDAIIRERGERVQFQLEVDLRTYLDKLQEEYNVDIDQLVESESLKKIGFWTVALAGLKRSDRERIANAVKATVSTYIQGKLDAWSEQATAMANSEVESLREVLQRRIEEFRVELAHARAEFFGGDEKLILAQQDEIAVPMTMRVIFGGSGLWGMIGGTLRRLFILLALLSLGSLTPLGWILLILAVLAEGGLPRDQLQYRRKLLLRTLDTIMQSIRTDLANETFSTFNLRDLPALANMLRNHERPLDKFLWGQLPSALQQELTRLDLDDSGDLNMEQVEKVRDQLIEALNRIIQQPLYTPARFEGIGLADLTQQLMDADEESQDVVLLNRNLLVDAFPDVLAPKLKDALSSTIKAQFVNVARGITDEMRAQVDQLQQQMDATVRELAAQEFSAESESARLDAISANLLLLVNTISQAAAGRTYTLDELLAQSGQNQ